MALKIFFDGGCRPNPGRIEVAVVARGVARFRDDLGEGTNNDAEWLALLEAVAVARTLDVADVILIGDSALVVHQANGEWACRGAALQRHLARFRDEAAGLARMRLRWIGRHQNLAGIALERRRAAGSRASGLGSQTR